MDNDRPIIFTVRENYKYHKVQISTEDSRALFSKIYSTYVQDDGEEFSDLFNIIHYISEELNDRGYAVLFKVE